MNFTDSPQESIYRATVREWLANNAPRYTVSRRAPEVERLGIARAWQACKAAAGYARVSWPRDWGGTGGTTIQQMIFTEEEARYGVPTGFFGIGLGMCIPTLMRFPGIASQQRFAGPRTRGEQIVGQLVSWPVAVSPP